MIPGWWIVPFLFAMAFLALVSYIKGISTERHRMKQEAVSRGYAEYTLVDGGPNTEFRWKEKP